MAASTRPLTLGEILDRTVQLYRRNFLLLAGIATPAAALIVLISGSAILFLSSHLFSLAQASSAGQPAPLDPQEMLVFGLVFVVFLLVGVPILLGVFGIVLAALNYAAYQVNRGETVTIRSSYGYAFHYFWRHIGILFLQTLFAWMIPYGVFIGIFMIGAMLAAFLARSGAGKIFAPLLGLSLVVLILVMLVACVLLWLRFSLAYPASVAEDQKAWPSLKRSNRLSQSSRGRIFVMFLLVFVLNFVASAALAIPIDIVIALSMQKSFVGSQPPAAFLTFLQAANLGVGFLVRIFIMPIYAVALVLFYIDQRTRIEGYDIEQLMVQAGWPELPPAPTVDTGHPQNGPGASPYTSPEGTGA
jgi:hypothetical protein